MEATGTWVYMYYTYVYQSTNIEILCFVSDQCLPVIAFNILDFFSLSSIQVSINFLRGCFIKPVVNTKIDFHFILS